jgi:hypothetical protein
MKYVIAIFASLVLSHSAIASVNTAGKGEIKRICYSKKDKEGKEVQDKAGKKVKECKDIKVRRKLETTETPPSKDMK